MANMLSPEDYRVGWICAISTEYVVAQAFLDEKHDSIELVSQMTTAFTHWEEFGNTRLF